MKAEGDAEKDSPEEEADAGFDAADQGADDEQRRAEEGQRDPVEFADPDMEAVFGEVGRVMGEGSGLGVKRLAGDDPTDVGPPLAFLGRVRVALFVAVLMVDAVGGYPGDGAAFKG